MRLAEFHREASGFRRYLTNELRTSDGRRALASYGRNIWRLAARYAFGLDALEDRVSLDARRLRGAFRRMGKAGHFPEGFHPAWLSDQYKSAILYGICEQLLPSIVIEIGVASGTSSLGILTAMSESGKGHLYSIDLPETPYVRDDGRTWIDSLGGKQTGWRVKDSLKSYWTLCIGSSKQLLPDLLRHVGQIDVFYHDGEHKFATMLREMELAWSHMRPGGIMVVDNVNWNGAFERFVKQESPGYSVAFPYVGVLRKSERVLSGT